MKGLTKRQVIHITQKLSLKKYKISDIMSAMREVVLDTETTGLYADKGDRVVDIGCVELINHRPTGKVYHQYLNPERAMNAEALAVHGISDEDLKDKPKFGEVADAFLDFIKEDPLIIHNAPFDIGFLNMELAKVGKPLLKEDRVIDTLVLARKKYPGSQVNLNALCKRFDVDLSKRTVHGALVDCELLADVYLAMILDKELKFNQPTEKQEKKVLSQNVSRETLPPRKFEISPEELTAHNEFMKKIKDNIWGIS